VALTEAQTRVWAALGAAGQPLTTEEVREAARLSPGATVGALNHLRRQGVRYAAGGRLGTLWWLPTTTPKD